jgi:hypothetical protein
MHREMTTALMTSVLYSRVTAIRGHLGPAAAALGILLVITLPFRAQAAEIPVHHRLEVALFPADHRLSARDAMRIDSAERQEIIFALSERAAQIQVAVEGRPRSFRFNNSELRIRLTPEEGQRPVELAISYEAAFNDPVPVNPLNTDNPGFGVTGVVSEAGTFLLAGAGWYPDLVDGRETFDLTVKAPPGIIAVTSGRGLGYSLHDGATWSRWQVELPVRGLSLSAAAYRVAEREVDGVVAATYFLEGNQDLASNYLEAIARYLRLYTERFGPYPFSKFAVVENFFPTGYGFPSYTLLGSTVIRLPFIIDTSLGHEIAHCWWGNGVLVNYEFGNWSEGLTTYVADYLYKEMASAAEARDYRLQALRSYAVLVPPAKEFPLSRFTSRTDPVSKAIGYDKGFMVFHMLRKMIGEEAFWGALRDIRRERLFQAVSWFDLKTAFAKRSGLTLDDFFKQWVFRQGAPRLRFDSVQAARSGENWQVTGSVVQDAPPYALHLNLALESGGGATSGEVSLRTAEARFSLVSPAEPLRLTADPDYHVFRRLAPSEIPPTINSLKGSSAVLIVVARAPGEKGRRLAGILAESLGLNTRAPVAEEDLAGDSMAGRDVLVIGYPTRRDLLAAGRPEGFRVESGGFSLDGRSFDGRSGAFFGVFGHPVSADRVLALFLPPDSPQAEAVAAKITHYGRYSYLVFEQEQNRAKGVWTPQRSPLAFRWHGG